MCFFEKKYETKIVYGNKNWGGYIVKPYLFEFWQRHSNRTHDKLQ